MLDPDFVDRIDAQLAADDAERRSRYPGPPTEAQPVHTVYVPGDRFRADTPAAWGAAALHALDEFGPLPGVAADLDALVRSKLGREPIEDLRIDFEDGYGRRSDEREDADVRAAAAELAAANGRGRAPAAVGVRMKSLEDVTRRRGIRSLELFLEGLGPLPTGFRITLPKVTSVAQVAAFAEVCGELERAHGIDALQVEIQIETAQAVLAADGTALVARLLDAAAGRCIGLHFGTYDYTAALGIAAAQQSMEHPAADHAKAVVQLAAAQRGVFVSDGSTNVLPVGDRDAVQAAWALHSRLVRRSLERGFYQGWDLHPAQLPTRFAATFAFYRDGYPAAADRLRRYRERAEGGVLDEPATAQALAGFLLRAVRCGAVAADEVAECAGCSVDELAALSGVNPPSR
jgi:citrate lyase beta subunit